MDKMGDHVTSVIESYKMNPDYIGLPEKSQFCKKSNR